MKFREGEIVVHLKSGKRYVILGTPDYTRLEADCSPAYRYTAEPSGCGSPTFDEPDYIEWVRSQTEMEDGRFDFPPETKAERRRELLKRKRF